MRQPLHALVDPKHRARLALVERRERLVLNVVPDLVVFGVDRNGRYSLQRDLARHIVQFPLFAVLGELLLESAELLRQLLQADRALELVDARVGEYAGILHVDRLFALSERPGRCVLRVIPSR